MDPHSCEADDEKSDSTDKVNPDNLHKLDPSQKGGVWKHKGKDRQMKRSTDAEEPKVWILHCTYLQKNSVEHIDPKIYQMSPM